VPRAAAVLFLLAGCATVTPTPTPEPTPLPVPLTFEVGVEYPLMIWTMCGAEGSFIDHDPWGFDGDPTGEGFVYPQDHGTIVRLDQDHAIYTTELGQEFTMTRLDVIPSFVPCF
jgi:hypothetical protein